MSDTILDLPGLHLSDVERIAPDGLHRRGLIRLTVATDPVADDEIVACHGCGVLAADHGRRVHRLADAPIFGTPTELVWRKRRWRCREARCEISTWTEDHPDLPARAKLTTRAVSWAVQTLRWDDSTIAAIARQLGVDWHTLMDAVTAHTAQSLDSATAKRSRLANVDTLGIDEHIWKHAWPAAESGRHQRRRPHPRRAR